MADAKVTDQHLAGGKDTAGAKVTLQIEPQPVANARMRQEFLGALQSALGPQRAALLEQAAGSWLDSNIASTDGEPKTVSAVRHPDGSFNISIQSGTMWMSTGGDRSLRYHVPRHLLPFFSALEENAGDSGQPAP